MQKYETFYLVRANIRIVRYMNENNLIEEDLRLVSADSIYQAEEKYRKFWHDKDCEYDIYHYVDILGITETLF